MKNVEDIYPVIPMQKLMLLHSVAQSPANTLFNQFSYDIDGPFDEEAFKFAWIKVIERHSALRTGFVWEDVKEPLQVVRKIVETDFSHLDWREFSSTEIEIKFQDTLSADRIRGFDLRRPPLLRFCFIRLTDEQWRFVWSSHHLIIDRWCLGQIFSELDEIYRLRISGRKYETRTTVTNFRTYVDWIQRQDKSKAHAFWVSYLRGIRRATCMTIPAGDSSNKIRETEGNSELHLQHIQFDRLRKLARQHGVTLNTIVQGAWSLTMNRILGKQDVVFGATVSGRPADIPNIESIIGSFVNNVPVRIQLPANKVAAEWLVEIQALQFSRLHYDHVAPADIQRCSQFSDSEPMFDALIVWLSDVDPMSQISMQPVSLRYETAYPLTLSILERSDELTFRVDTSRQCVVDLPKLLGELEQTLNSLVAMDSHTSLEHLPGFRIDTAFASTDERQSENHRNYAMEHASGNDVEGFAGGREKLGTDVLHELLSAEWSLVLGMITTPDNVSFFDLGGTSLQAANLHIKIEKAVGQSIPLLALFRVPTIKNMVHVVFDRDWPLKADVATALRTTGQGPGLFCVASPEVNAVGYAILTRHLPKQQNVFTLQSPPQSHQLHQITPDSLPDIAGEYIVAMRNIQRDGPYRLLGMCTGSHIALEMAKQLQSDGEDVEFLGIINTWALYTISRLYHLNRFINIVGYYGTRIRDLFSASGMAQASTATDQRSVTEQTETVAAEAADRTGDAWIHDVGFATNDPCHPDIRVPTSVFRLRSQPFWRIRSESLGWSKHAASTSVVNVSGTDHDAILREPYVQNIGTAISACLTGLNTPHSPLIEARSQSPEGIISCDTQH